MNIFRAKLFKSTLATPVIWILISLFLVAGNTQAHNKVVVIPLAGNDVKQLKNIVTVAKENGDFTLPNLAVSSITDASAANPYLIVIAPGEYNLNGNLTMKPYVSISGSGREVTRLIGAGSNDGMVRCADNTELSDLSIEATTPTFGSFNIAVGCTNTSPRLTRLSVSAQGGRFNYTTYIRDGASPELTDYKTESNSAADANIGIFIQNASPIMNNVTAIGINTDASSLGTGVDTISVSSPIISNSTMQGTTFGVRLLGATGTADARITHSTVIGGIDDTSAGNQCRSVYDDNLDAVGC